MNNKKVDIDLKHGLMVDEELLNTPADTLCHYGRKGMKWGQNIFGKISAPKGGKKKNDSDEQEETPSAKHPVTVVSSKKNEIVPREERGIVPRQENGLVPVGVKPEKETVEAEEILDAKFKDVKTDTKENKPKEDPIDAEIEEHPNQESNNSSNNRNNQPNSQKERVEEVVEEVREESHNNTNNNSNTNSNINNNNSNGEDGITKAAKVATSVSKASQQADKVTQALGKLDNEKRVKQELDQLDNAELKRINERLTLERQYKDLNKDRLAKGYDVVHKTFNLAVPVAAFVATGLSLYKDIRDLRRG